MRTKQNGPAGKREEELEAKLAKVLQALMEEEIRGEQARQREASALMELSHIQGFPGHASKSQRHESVTAASTSLSLMDIWTPGGNSLTPVKLGASTEGNQRKQGMCPWSILHSRFGLESIQYSSKGVALSA